MSQKLSVVGYSGGVLQQNGQLVTAQFLGVGNADHFFLSDLKVTGYENNIELTVNVGATGKSDFNFYQLDDHGISQKDTTMYWWSDEYNDEGGFFNGGKWIGVDNQPVTKAHDQTIDPGKCFWFYCGLKRNSDGKEKFVLEFPTPIADHSAE